MALRSGILRLGLSWAAACSRSEHQTTGTGRGVGTWRNFARDPEAELDFPVQSQAVLLRTLHGGCLFWSCSFPPRSHCPVWKDKTRRVSRMDDTGARDQNLTCVSKGFSMVGNLVLASEDWFFLHSLSHLHNIILIAAGFQVNKYSKTRK